MGKHKRCKIGPHSLIATFKDLDGRTAHGRILRQTARDLAAHVGGKPSATQRVLIERAAQYRLRLAMLDAKAATGAMTDTDERWWSHWSSGLARIMRDLGPAAPPSPKPKTLAEHIAGKGRPL